MQQGERANDTDYKAQGAAANKRLSWEQAADEVTWSAGETLGAAQVAEAFAIEPGARAAMQRDAAPVAGRGAGAAKVLFIVFALCVLAMILSTCSGDDCNDRAAHLRRRQHRLPAMPAQRRQRLPGQRGWFLLPLIQRGRTQMNHVCSGCTAH